MASAMELNDINLLVLTGLVSLSLIGLSLSLTIWGFLFGLISPFVAERFWPWLLNTIGANAMTMTSIIQNNLFILSPQML